MKQVRESMLYVYVVWHTLNMEVYLHALNAQPKNKN